MIQGCPWSQWQILASRHGAVSTDIQNESIVGVGRLPHSVQQAWEARQCVPERAVHQAVSVNPQVLWRLEKVREASNLKCLREAARSDESQPKRHAVGLRPPATR